MNWKLQIGTAIYTFIYFIFNLFIVGNYNYIIDIYKKDYNQGQNIWDKL